MVLALVLLALTGSLIIVQWRLLRGRAYTTVSGRGFKAAWWCACWRGARCGRGQGRWTA
ncbi:hypothetical protein [Reyranella sp.]|uniref:hypothetical protein n=1 Tax=Reyranella sp. TaxID=1929291 RepID=UPI0037847325